MPNWGELLEEIKTAGSTHDVIRRKYIKQLSDHTGRNVIVYYSGWLQKRGLQGVDVNDADKNGFMNVIHHLDRSKGLDLLIHTPGGDTAATESLVDYLRSMFGTDIRAIVPQIALSAGTMIACACREIIMGKQSSLGPIDPQLNGIAAHGVLEEFQKALATAKSDPGCLPLMQAMVAKYPPAFIGECEKAIAWTNEMVTEWLRTGMFAEYQNAQERIPEIVKNLSDHALTKAHNRHLSATTCRELGLKITLMEDEPGLQDAVLSVHHMCIHTLGATPAFKIIENQNGNAFIQIAQQVVVQGG